MRITFDVPHLFEDGSRLSKNGQAILRSCMHELRRACGKSIKPLARHGSLVTFELPHVFHADSTPAENAQALRILLHALVAINEDYLSKYPRTPRLYDAGIVYDRTEVWDSIPALYRRRYGDCKSLACALVAERHAGGRKAEPVFRWIASRPDRSKFDILYHILVLGEEGWEDPSKVCGMAWDRDVRG